MIFRKLAALAAALFLLAGPAIASDCSGTITAGTTAQTVFSSSNVRRLMLQNNSAVIMCFSINGAAATLAGTNCGAGSYGLTAGTATVAGGMFTSSDGAVISTLSVISANTGDRFSCERQ